MPAPSYDLEAWRRRIPILRRGVVPMNACSQAPLIDATREAAEAFLASWDHHGMDWPGWLEEVGRAKAAFARLVGGEADEVAVCSSVSEAAAVVASALDLTARPKVLSCDAEFPTVSHVWLAQRPRGARVEWVPLRDGAVEVEDWEARLDGETAVASVTHGYYQNGFVQDVAAVSELARERGAMVFVDAYQTAGVVPVDARAMGADFVTSGNLKYLMGTPGIAFLWVRRELHERLEPAFTGWFGRADPFAFDARRLDWAPDARRFEAGTPPLLPAYVARAGMEVIGEVGVEAIREHTGALSRRLLDGARERGLEVLGPADRRRKTPSTAVRCPGDSHAVEERLREHGVLASARGPAVRLAPHFYSSAEDVDRALDALAREIGRG